MEHLFVALDDRTMASKIAEACNSRVLREDDPNTKTSLVAPVQPFTEWRGFDHDGPDDGKPLVQNNLADYPKVRGWTIDLIWDEGELRKAHPSLEDETVSGTAVGEHVAAMIQSWLYFGFLEAFLGKRVHTSYFLRIDETGMQYLHSGYLGFALYVWMLSVDESELESLLERSWDNLMTVTSVVQLLYLWTDPADGRGIRTEHKFPGFTGLVVDMLPSVVRLFDAISSARDRIAAESGRRIVVLQGPAHTTAGRDHRLLQRGWCPFLLKFCRNSLHDSVLDWLDGSQRNDLSGGHEGCKESECARNNIDPRTYKTRHIDETCQCDFIRPNLAQVLSIIDQGRIPVILPRENSVLDVLSHDPSTQGRYVAVSHVWVDGLGSATERGLPTCQIEKITKLVLAASESSRTPFWIDSLCIPESKKHRKASIALLRDIYQRASSVLVIDRTISACQSPDNAPIEDLLWAITSSAWAQRLWTYQESYLASKVQFCVAGEQIVTWDRDFEGSRNITTLRILYTSFEQHLRSLRPPGGPETATRRTNIGQVATALNWRSTSRRSDETLAVAALLCVDTHKLVDTPADPPAERMKQLYLLVGDMPRDIIFFDGARMTSPPFRWAPESLMARSPVNIDSADQAHNATCTRDGLRGEYLALVVVEPPPLRGGSGKRVFVRGAGVDGLDAELFCIDWDTAYLQNPVDVMFDTVLVREVDEGIYLKPEIGVVVEAVAVCTKSRSSTGIITCNWAGRVTMLKYRPDDSDAPPEKNYLILRTVTWKKSFFLIE